MKLAVSFTNLGPYHLARLRGAAAALARRGGSLVAIETAGAERLYPWRVNRLAESFAWQTLFPGRAVEDLAATECAEAIQQALDATRPDAVAVAGYVRPECLAALRWARRHARPAILMSESQRVDRPRVWWKESLKARRVRAFDAALVGGPSHRDYLVELGMPADRIALGYNAIDHDWYATRAAESRRYRVDRAGLPLRPYLLCVCRFAPEKNLPLLVRAYAEYRRQAGPDAAWDLALCGDGPEAPAVDALIRGLGLAWTVHQPGFLQAVGLVPWYAHAGAFVLPSLSEPWGLVASEAAACGTPLLLSERAGCAATLVPDPPGTTGWRFDPSREADIAAALGRMAAVAEPARRQMGQTARDVAAVWGSARFGSGLIEALEFAQARHGRRAVACPAATP